MSFGYRKQKAEASDTIVLLCAVTNLYAFFRYLFYICGYLR